MGGDWGLTHWVELRGGILVGIEEVGVWGWAVFVDIS